MNDRPKRILAVASGGGHWVQLCRLAPAWDGCAVTYLTTDPGYREGVIATAVERGQPEPGFYVMQEFNRKHKRRLLKALFEVTKVVLKTRPDVIITTGAAPGFVALFVGSWLRRRTIWIDSIANAEELSMSGRIAKRYASHWLTQWEHLATPEGPDHHGSVI